jgi:hypothetical protein
MYDTIWEIPGKSTSISVNTLLPAGVQTSSDNSAFQVVVSPSSVGITRSLSQDCAACVALNGLSAPKPPFSGGGTASLSLPSSVATATLVNDTISVAITNGFTFDPLRPSSSARGHLLIMVRNGSTTIGRDSIDGSTTALAAGATLVRKIPLTGTITGANGIQVSTSMLSPLGDNVLIDVSRTVSAVASLGTFFISHAQVNVANQAVTSAPTALDLSGMDTTLTKHVSSGTLLLTVANPFNVAGNLAVTVGGAASPIQKTLTLAGGTTKPSIEFTKAELASMFGRNLSLTFNGNVTGSSVVVAPGQVVSVGSRLRLTVAVGAK